MSAESQPFAVEALRDFSAADDPHPGDPERQAGKEWNSDLAPTSWRSSVTSAAGRGFHSARDRTRGRAVSVLDRVDVEPCDDSFERAAWRGIALQHQRIVAGDHVAS